VEEKTVSARRLIAAFTTYALLATLLLFAGAVPADAASPIPGEYVPDEIIVRFADGVADAEQQQINAQNGAVQVDNLTGVSAKVLRVSAGSLARALRAYRGDARVRYAELNYIVHAIAPAQAPLAALPNDPRFGELWGLKNTGQTIGGTLGTPGADISAERAWDLTKGSKSVVVGIVDTGISYNHEDLAANVWTNTTAVNGCGTTTHGYNAINNTCDPLDDHDHGSHVSGTIGAVGNNVKGVVGVNWDVSLMGLKFLDASGSGTTANAVKAIGWATDAKRAGVNVRVLSNSWGGGGFSQALLDAINRADVNGILFVAAAGNSSADNDTTPHYPSSYTTPNMIAVAATDNRDDLASFSNYGATSVHLGAPGVNILSSTRATTSYAFFSGTSMATPHVAGAAALILSKATTLTVAELKAAILNNTDPLPSLAGRTTSGGRLNVFKACNATPGCGGPPPAPDFTLSITPSSATVTQGASASYTVNISRVGGFTGGVSFSISGLPAGAAGTFNPNPSTGASSALAITTATSTPTGSYVFTVTGTSGAMTRTATATLVVTPPSAGDFSLSVSPTSQTAARGTSTTYNVTITRTGGFSGAVTLSTTGPTGTTTSFSPNPATTTSTLTVAIGPNAATGTFTLTITGVSGTLTRTTTATLVITQGCIGGDGDC
jgi:subtilisin family serine protease